ncbi:hypothetical protein ACQEU8_03650 [Streptomyces sp. CA-250714]|uniref:hypothetical protein n=1 Tax=Streptomyces sp. CA-250714 TaxID=3240060 RepID=UPI003D8D75DE
MADAGMPPHVLGKIAGHGSLTTTQRYSHPDQQAVELAGSALSAHLATSQKVPGPQMVPSDETSRHLRIVR